MSLAEHELTQLISQTEALISMDLDELLAPIEAGDDGPAGPSLRENGIYDSIEEARRAEPDYLPQGVWEHSCKKAEWQTVVELTQQALAGQSKDLQLAVWLLEALIHTHGFAGLSAGLTIMTQLCDKHWSVLHPIMHNGGTEHRANLFAWMDNKLPTSIRLIPFTETDKLPRNLNWADWESAKLRAHLTPESEALTIRDLESLSDLQQGEVNAKIFSHGVNQTNNAFYQSLAADIRSAQHALNALSEVLHQCWDTEAPAFSQLRQLIIEITAYVEQVLKNRGILASASTTLDLAADSDSDDAQSEGADSDDDQGSHSGGGGGGGGPVKTRAEAYRQIGLLADFLRQIEPHSPVPFLLERAVHWGNMDTRALYEELFQTHKGQMSIFEIIGLNPEE